MRVLLDTHVFLWWVADASELTRKARQTIANPSSECLLSLASCWEMAIKLSIGKLRLKSSIERFIPEQMAANRIELLGIDFRHIVRVASLPPHHRDPFDRLLAAQAIDEKLPIVSADRVLSRYGVRRIW